MSNQITKKYFDRHLFNNMDRVVKEVVQKTGFTIEKEIFRGVVYDDDKIGSLIFKGTWHNKCTVLKIQGLQLEHNEKDIITAFNKQNTSTIIRVPQIYESAPWNKERGYGYLLLEYIDGQPLSKHPFVNECNMEEFCKVYQEYKTHCLNEPLFPKDKTEQNALDFTLTRIDHWKKIAISKNTLTDDIATRVETFRDIAHKHLPTINMEFMHGHLAHHDIIKRSNNEYIFMSNLFWSWRPEWYDTTFHLWADIKAITDTSVTAQQVLTYLDQWLDHYKVLSVVQKDPDFERKFNMMMLERYIGALLIDIKNQHYTKNREKYEQHLLGLFSKLFDHFSTRE